MTSPAPDDVCVVGAGYVGAVTAACLADAGHRVRLVEIDADRLAVLRSGRAPIHEPGLDALLARLLGEGSLTVTDSMAEGAQDAGVVLIAVGTPPTPEGDADLGQVHRALREAHEHAPADAVLAIKSTVPPGTTQGAARRLRRPVVMCPEFLREGSALHDFTHPTRVVVGGADAAACRRVAALFAHLDTTTILTDATSAELIKYGTNAFLALKISFINEIAQLCELTGATVDDVAAGMGLDPRVGRAFLNAGLGFGGSCFPKDVRALEATAGYHGQSFWMLKAAVEVNARQRRRFVTKVTEALGGDVARTRVALLGLAFKPGTDDMRQAPSVEVARYLDDAGAVVVATDPVALERARPLLPAGVTLVGDVYECIAGADCVVLVTEWPEYRDLDWERLAGVIRRRIVVDGRNCLDGEHLTRLGFAYHSVGRPSLLPD